MRQGKPSKRPSPETVDYPSPIATVDVALFTLREGTLHVLALRRAAPPFAGELALPGGYVHIDEDVDAADTARRVLREKVALDDGYFLEQLFTFSGRVRDPRGWSISIAYYAVVRFEAIPQQSAVHLIPADDLPDLPFDHNRIIIKALERLRGKSAYSTLPAYLLPETFTLRQLHGVYERVMGERLDLASFRRKIEDQEIVEAVKGEMRQRPGAGRPAQLYRLSARTLREFDRMI